MNKQQKTYTAFIESVCNKFNCPEATPALQEGFQAFCEAMGNDMPLDRSVLLEKYAKYNDLHQLLDALRNDFKCATQVTPDSKENVCYIDMPCAEFIVKCIHKPYENGYDVELLDVVVK